MPSVAPAEERKPVWLPPLDQCFSGANKIISWAAVADALRDTNTSLNSSTVHAFLEDELSVKALSESTRPSRPPNGQAKADFETRTSAINVAQSDAANHNITQIKDDAQWLARHAKIDELAALRTVVLEWQDRPRHRLLGTYSEEEDISLNQILPSREQLSQTRRGPPMTGSQANGEGNADRRTRVMKTWYQEQEDMLLVRALMVDIEEEEQEIEAPPTWLDELNIKCCKSADPREEYQDPQTATLAQLVDTLRARTRSLDEVPEALSDDLDRDWSSHAAHHGIQQVLIILRLALLLVHATKTPPSPPIIANWFRLLSEAQFMQGLPGLDDVINEKLQSNLSLLMASLLSFQETMALLNASSSVQPSPNSYALDPQCVEAIATSLMSASEDTTCVALPLVFWSAIGSVLRERGAQSAPDGVERRDSHPLASATQFNAADQKYGQAWRAFAGEHGSSSNTSEGPIELCLRTAIQTLDLYGHCRDQSVSVESTLGRHLFGSTACSIVRQILFSALQTVNRFATYDASLVEAFIACLQGRATDSEQFADIQSELIARFYQDSDCRRLLSEAFARAPFEIRPLLLLCQALVLPGKTEPELFQHLHSVPTFTDAVPELFNGYETAREQEYDNCFILREGLPLFPQSASQSFSNGYRRIGNGLSGLTDAHVIPAGTEGLALSKEHPPIISWNHQHSMISYLGRWLSEAHQGRLFRAMSQEDICLASADCLDLFALLVDYVSAEGRQSDARDLLTEVGNLLPPHTDIVTTVAEILEDTVSSPLGEDDAADLSRVGSCLSFLASVARPLPGRVWPLLSRSVLIENAGSDGRLLALITSSERTTTSSALLQNTLELLDVLIDDVILNASPRLALRKPRSRYQEAADVDPGIPNKQMSRVLVALCKIVLVLVREAHGWHFETTAQQAEVVQKGVTTLERLVHYHFKVGQSELGPAFLSPMADAASLVLAFFFSTAQASTNLSRLFAYMIPTVAKSSTERDDGEVSALVGLAGSCLSFVTMLLQVASEHLSKTVCEGLAQAIPVITRLYAMYAELQASVASLLCQIAQVVGSAGNHSISLFGAFGPDLARDAIAVLSDLSDATDRLDLAAARWDMFAACVRSKQTWFASYLLTGTVPSRESRQLKRGSQMPVLEITLEVLSAMPTIATPAAVATLAFVRDAADHWPWAIDRVRTYPQFLARMAEHLDNLRWEPDGRNDVKGLSQSTASAAYICEIFAMCFHAMRGLGNTDFVKEWSNKIRLLDQPGFKDPYYKKDMHQRLKENFERYHAGFQLEDFRRKLPDLDPTEDSYFDLPFLTQVLSTSGRQSTGFLLEFELADENLQLVAAQKRLISGWQLLCLELVQDAQSDDRLPKKLAYVAHECLEANKESEETGCIFPEVRDLRIDLVSTILQRMLDLRYTGGGVHTLLNVAWAVMRSSKPDFNAPFGVEDAGYYRSCVKLLLLCIRAYTIDNLVAIPESRNEHNDRNVSLDKINIMIEITESVVAKGFRSLANQLHEQPSSVLPADFVLLTSILQAVLQVRGADNTFLFSQIAVRLQEYSLGQYATALFSWSDRITATDHDPIYGEISVNFLAEMSALPSLSEGLAVEGVLSQLNTTSLMSYYQRRGGIGPFEEPARMHKIWTRGILPLTLNILVAVGSPVAAEVATFLNNFAPQLELASTALDDKGSPTARDPTSGCITLNTACEAHTLALISVLLDHYRVTMDADVPELLWDRVAVKEDVETWTQGTRTFLRERIVPTNEKEVLLLKTKPVGGDPQVCEVQSRLEEVVLKELKGAMFAFNEAATAA